MNKIKSMIEIFWNLVNGLDEFEKEWKAERERSDISEDEE